MRRGLEPPEPAAHDPARMSAEDRARCGIRPLPASLPEALEALQADPVLFGSLGGLLGPALVAIRSAEAAWLDALTPDEARRAHLRVF